MPLTVENLSYTYRTGGASSITALKNINLTIAAGECVGIVGRTGSGKSTLLQLLAGLLTPTAGRVLLDGRDINARNYDRSVLRRTVSVMFQFPEYQLFAPTVAQDVAFGLQQIGLPTAEISRRVKWALEMMGFDYDEVASLSPLALSGGEKRRVAIASVLAMQPRVFLCDEPVAGLDPLGRMSFIQLLQRLRRSGTTIIMVSHNMDVLSECAERLVVLDHGEIVAAGPTWEVLTQLPQTGAIPYGMSMAQEIAGLLVTRGVDLGPGVITYADLLAALKTKFGRGENA